MTINITDFCALIKMKKAIISLVLTMMSVAGYAQSVVGKWVTEGGDSQVEIYQSGDKLNGKIVWLKKGDGQLDVHNPDKKLQSRKLVGVNILTGLTKKGDKWEGGKIYNPKNGKTCVIRSIPVHFPRANSRAR